MDATTPPEPADLGRWADDGGPDPHPPEPDAGVPGDGRPTCAPAAAADAAGDDRG